MNERLELLSKYLGVVMKTGGEWRRYLITSNNLNIQIPKSEQYLIKIQDRVEKTFGTPTDTQKRRVQATDPVILNPEISPKEFPSDSVCVNIERATEILNRSAQQRRLSNIVLQNMRTRLVQDSIELVKIAPTVIRCVICGTKEK